jgi:hypothetical protein
MSHFSVVPFAFCTCHNMVIANLLLFFWFRNKFLHKLNDFLVTRFQILQFKYNIFSFMCHLFMCFLLETIWRFAFVKLFISTIKVCHLLL